MSSENSNTISCADVGSLLCDYVDGALHGRQRALVEQHLSACPACRIMAEEAAVAVDFLANIPEVEPPDELVTRLLFKVPSSGRASRSSRLRDWLGSWIRPVLQPRFAMGMAMTILSFSLLSRFAGISDRPLAAADLHPVRVWQQVDDRLHRTWDSLVKYYDNLRVVIEIQNRLNEWTVEPPAAGNDNLIPPEADRFQQPSTAVPEADERSIER